MTSQEYIEEYPLINRQQAEKIMSGHDFDEEEDFFRDYQPNNEGLWNSTDLFGWMGY